jgi:hypothetical protein
MKKFAIHGLPRSGTTWIGEIVNSSPSVKYGFQPLFSYHLRGFIGECSSKEDILSFFSKLRTTRDSFICQDFIRSQGKLPQFEKTSPTHVGYKEVRYHQVLPNILRKCDDIKLVLIERNPLAVISSWLEAPREFRSDLGWVANEEWRYALKKNLNRPEEYNGYERWKEATYLFRILASSYEDQVSIVRYEDLLKYPVQTVQKMFKFLELPYTEQTNKFLSKIEADEDPYSVNRSKNIDSKWESSLDQEIIDAVYRDLEGSILADLLPF